MKKRNAFVSNSSSCSFIISRSEYKDICDLACHMIGCREWEEEDEKLIGKIRENYHSIGLQNCGISFNTCNYHTYILPIADCFVVSTCTNHLFYLKNPLDELSQEVFEGLSSLGMDLKKGDAFYQLREEIENSLQEIGMYWYPEYDLIGNHFKSTSFCFKHNVDFIKPSTDTQPVCPLCFKEEGKPKINPIEVFDKLLNMVMLYTPVKKPGAMLKLLSKEEREALSKLSSDQVKKRRADWTLAAKEIEREIKL